MTAEEAETLKGRVAYTTSLDDLEGVDGVMEAVVEDPRVKGKLFKTLDELLPDARFLASNTSSIPIAEIGSWTQRPDRVLGLHFFSPVPVMKLVEVVVALDTAPETITVAESFASGIGKRPIQTKDRSGFIVNMLLVPYLMAAVRMFEDGFATREDIDEGMRLVEVVVALDTSPETVAVARAFVTEIGKSPIETKDRSGFIVNMLLVPYLMAAVRMYEEGFASADDIDTGMQLGCGHPMGPLTLCDFIGLDVLYAVCDSLYEEFKRDEYAPPPLMKRMVASGRLGRKSGRGFYDYTLSDTA
jgi:3-hydroxyacyl-CoA dehydrogenase